MRGLHTFSFIVALPLFAACASGTVSDIGAGASSGTGGGDSNGSGGASSSSSSSSSSSGGGIPSDCAQADQSIGCCTSTGILYYCTSASTVHEEACAAGTVCGWNASKGYYDCVAPPGGADPSHSSPLLCDAASSSGSSSSSSASSSSSGSGGAVTWTTLYGTIFGPTGTSSCVRNGSCHTNDQSGFACGTTKTSCYTGMINKGLITPGASASSSELVNPSSSPLCGSLGGAMPQGGTCVTSAQVSEIEAWLASGAPDD
jgi:hypothetical protein